MSQHISQIPLQQMQMKLEQRLTPQLIQSMEILQLPVTALEARIQEELERNPTLEIDTNGQHISEEPTIKPDGGSGSQQDGGAATADERSFNRLDSLSRQYDFDQGDQESYARRPAVSGERDAKLDAMANTPARSVSLQEYLVDQILPEEVHVELRRAMEMIISYIDDDGFLRTPLEEIAETTNPPISADHLEEALLELQHRVDPSGIGARSLQECLLLQLRSRAGHDKDKYALERELIQNHFEDIKKNRLPNVVKSTGRSIEEVKSALHAISQLDMTPGYTAAPKDLPHITPDVIVDYAEDGEGYTVRLARGNSPSLRISAESKQIVKDRSQDKTTRDFVKKNLESANALIDAIQYRRQRLLELARVIIERQRDFFENGPQAMKILRMSELAEEFECDPSTISRTVAGKYMQMPRGIYSLRDFFTGGTENSHGESTSWDAVRARVKQIIDEEDKSKPLSDDQITKMLQNENLGIKRRTVAKYRQQLNIPSARQRKQF